jgi:predicted RNase H-like nuclease (RuvC/YqgF family)
VQARDVEEAASPQAPVPRRGSGTRKVTAQRKQNNRKAQQRYREKRKQQALEMEQQVAALTNQLDAMQRIQAEKDALSGDNAALRDMLAQKNAEIEDLRVRFLSSSPTCMTPLGPGISHSTLDEGVCELFFAVRASSL